MEDKFFLLKLYIDIQVEQQYTEIKGPPYILNVHRLCDFLNKYALLQLKCLVG